MKFYFIIISLFVGISLKSQVVANKGLWAYNPQMLNSSFIETKNNFQFDVIGFKRGTNLSYPSQGLRLNSIMNINTINSSVAVSFSKFDYYSIESNNINLGYAYRKQLSEKLKIKTGVLFNASDLNRKNNDREIKKHYEKNRYIDFGLATVISRLQIGATARFSLQDLKHWDYYSISDTTIESSGYSGSLFSMLYDFKPLGRFSFQFSWHKGFYYFQDLRTDTFEGVNYIGILIDYNDFVGLGFTWTWGDGFSIIGDIKVHKNLDLRLNLHNDYGFVYNNKFGWNIMSQIIWYI